VALKVALGLGLALLSAILLALSFPPNNLGVLAWVAWVPVIVAQFGLGASDRAARAYQAMAYAVFFEIVFVQAFPVDLLPDFVPIFAITPAVALIGLFVYVTGLPSGTPSFHRRTGYRWFLILPPLAWIGIEAARYLLELGHIWGMVAVTQWANLPLLQLATSGGMWLIGFVVMLGNYALGLGALMVFSRTQGLGDSMGLRGSLRWNVVAGIGMVLVAHVVGLALLGTGTHSVRVAALQLGGDLGDHMQFLIPWSARDWRGVADAVLNEVEPMTREAAARGAKLVVWPEAALWLDPQSDPTVRDRLVRLARETDAYLVVTYFLWPDDLPLSWFLNWHPNQRNEVTVVSPQGEFLGVAAKDHPIRYIGETGLTKGLAYPVYTTPFGKLSNMIGYDNAFTDTARHYTSRGAQLLTLSMHDWVATTDVYSKNAVLRAVENRAGLIRSDWRSGSLIADPFGRILAATPTDRMARQILIADLPLVEPSGTLYTRVGDWFGAIALFTTIGWLAYGMWEWWRARR